MSDKKDVAEEEFVGHYSVITIGNSAVGKTCLTLRFIDKEFQSSYLTTVGLDDLTKKVKKDEGLYFIEFWDTNGQERYAKLASQYFRKAHGVVFVYSVDDLDSFNAIKKWLTMLREENSKESICMMLLGNKCDADPSQRKVSHEQGVALGEELGMKFFETSAKTAYNIKESSEYLINTIIETNKKIMEEKKNKKLIRQKQKEKSKCCK